MRIPKEQLRRAIRESLKADSDFVFGAIEEMGYNIDDIITLDSNQVAINDAMAGYPGEFTYEDVVAAVEDKKAANKILGTRAGDYSSSQYGKKTNEIVTKITKRQLKRIIKEEKRRIQEMSMSTSTSDANAPGDELLMLKAFVDRTVKHLELQVLAKQKNLDQTLVDALVTAVDALDDVARLSAANTQKRMN